MTNERADDVAGATSRDFASGQKVFGRYTLIKILGRGGMGVVWLARDEELEREVALKFLPDLIIRDPEVLSDLKRETRRSLELTHQNIVRIYDFVHDERLGCISMEYVDGKTLAGLRCEKPQKVLEPFELSSWTSQLCDALDYAHNRARIIHRDLKPANLMVNQRGDLKVSDFGIARSLGDSMTMLTREQGRSGTLVYMSPQQLAGERGTHLDDIYSLGATFYDLLTSKPPFYSGNIDRQIHERVAPSMTERRKELDIESALVPAIWEEVVAACLAKDPSRRPQSAAEVANRLQLAPAQTRTRRAPGKSSNRKALLVGGIAALSVLALAGLYFGVLKRQAKPVSQAAAIPEKSIAVLPFVDMSEHKDEEYFADGLSEELIGMLTTVPELKVPARTSSFYFKGKQTTIADIAKALGVAHVLEGSVRKSGNTLRITAQLIRVDNGYHVWSETYDRKLDDIFKVQDEISAAVVKALKVSLLEGDMPKATRAANQEAYALFLQGRSLHYRGTHADAQKAITYMEQALKLDPTYAPAWFGLADSLVYDYTCFGGSYQDVHAQARAAAETALRLDPKLSDAHLAMGRILGELEWDWPAADAEFKRTLELDPNNVLALWCASGYALIGDRLDEALKLIQNAAARDAVGYGVYTGIGDVQIRNGRLAEAEAAYRKATELNATAAGTHLWLGFVLLARGESKAALAAMEQETDEGYRQYGLALAFGELGRQSDADRALAALEANYADSRAGHIASVYACRKQLDRAFAWLDRAYRQRDGWLPLIKADPCVKNLEPDPRYKALLRKLKLPE